MRCPASVANAWATRSAKSGQAGAATLVVVMVLFLIMAMMAAFGSRNLIFEQRVASNYYRAGVALEVAEAGIEWGLAQLNGLNIDTACMPNGAGPSTFRRRYLTIDPTNRNITPVYAPTATTDCVRNNALGWVCQCPAGPLPARLPLPSGNQMQPRFALGFHPIATPVDRPGVVRLYSQGCTDSGTANCTINSQFAREASLGMSNVTADIALVSALKTPPVTPLVVSGPLDLGANGIGLHNSEPRNSGLLLTTGAALPNFTGVAGDRLESLPGTPGIQAMLGNDPGLNNASATQVFKQYFGMGMASYRDQPAMRMMSCPQGDCGAVLLAAYNSGARLAWVDGPLTISSNITLGTATSPMLIVANGAVTLNGPMQLTGLLFSNGDLNWDNSSGMPALLTGALIVAGRMSVNGTVDLWYQAAVMDELSNRAGSFVRIPGGWWN
nr:pilus assembly PilX N-terminal domain-containing protein [uncultured Roseateles sp.]